MRHLLVGLVTLSILISYMDAFSQEKAKGKDKDAKTKDKKTDDKDKKKDALKHFEVQVKKQTREALIHVPKEPMKKGAPVVFVFHGHGGSMADAAREFGIHEEWPAAICVYMQGVPTATKSDPKGKFRGWQNDAGELADRDVLFFDAALDKLKKNHTIDERRIFATGFSNGAGFTYVLWAKRSEQLRAVAICAGVAGADQRLLTPKPCLHLAGRQDTQVDFARQQKVMDFVKDLNGCDKKGTDWGKSKGIDATYYASSKGTPFVKAIHGGGHSVPGDAGKVMVQFFKEVGKK